MPDEPPYRLGSITLNAKQFIDSCPQKIQGQLVDKIRLLLDNPFRTKTKQLQNQKFQDLPVRRITSGKYRLLYIVEDDKRTIIIVDAGLRRDIYERW